MKKVFLTALSLLAFASCNNDCVVDAPAPAAIEFEDSFVEIKTRAAIDPSITTATIDAFDVWGFMNAPTGVVFNCDRVSKGANGWKYKNIQYWTPNNNYYFAAVAPVDDSNITVDASGMNTTGLGKISFTNAAGTCDLLYATKNVTTGNVIADKPEAVKLQFAHLLSKIKFTFTNGFPNPYTTVNVTNVCISNAPKSGEINLAQEGWYTNNAWTITEAGATINFGNIDTANGFAQGESAFSEYERFTIPADANRSYTISFDVELIHGDQTANVVTKTVELSGVEFKIGKSYNLKADITPANLGLVPIEFEVVVEDWVPAEPDVTVM